MKKYLFGAVMLLVMGAGCTAVDTNTSGDERNEGMEDELTVGESGGRVADPIAFPSGTFEMYRATGYVLPIDQAFSVDQQGDQLRIQNFEGQDDPHYDYADDVFFIEIFSHASDSEADFRAQHSAVAEVELAEETVLKGEERIVAGDSWPGHSYYNIDRNVLVRLYYTNPGGNEIAEAILSHLSWE